MVTIFIILNVVILFEFRRRSKYIRGFKDLQEYFVVKCLLNLLIPLLHCLIFHHRQNKQVKDSQYY